VLHINSHKNLKIMF